jgi:hypothetical protein
MKKYLWSIAEFIIGILPGFFLVFNFMFTDVASISERAFSFLLVLVAYLVLGTAFGLSGINMRLGGIWLSLPALIFVFLYSFKETDSIIINLLYAATALIFSLTGYRFGANFL